MKPIKRLDTESATTLRMCIMSRYDFVRKVYADDTAYLAKEIASLQHMCRALGINPSEVLV